MGSQQGMVQRPFCWVLNILGMCVCVVVVGGWGERGGAMDQIKNASTKLPYWASMVLLHIDSILGFIAPSLLSEIRLVTETYIVFTCSYLKYAYDKICRRRIFSDKPGVADLYNPDCDWLIIKIN